MNISENLIRIKDAKDNIIKSLKNKGVIIDNNTLINEIPTIIDNAEIGGGGGDTPSVPTELVPKYEGASVFRIVVPTDNYEFAINLCNDATKATYDVDWGDGSLESGLTTDEQHHTYSKAGTYDVNIYNISKDITLGGSITIGGNSSRSIHYLFNNINNDNWGGGHYNYIKDNYNVTNVLIGGKITNIGSYAFYGCSSLQSIVIPNSVTSIGSYAFQNCSSLPSIVISNSITSIGNYAFQNCSSLQSIVIPNSVTNIGNYVFYGCSSLPSIVIPNSVTSIGSYAFQNCSALQSIVISNSITSIGSYTFSSCSSLQSIVIPNSVTSIASSAFSSCSSLQSITCPMTAPTIQSGSFPTSGFKYSKRYLYVPKNSLGYDSGNWKSYLIDKGWELIYIEDYEKEPTTLKLKTKNNFFHNLQAIGQANLINYELINDEYIYNFDDKITELAQYTFYDKVLEEIELPEGLEIIRDNTFYGYSSFQSIDLPNSVTSIGNYTFNNCSNLHTITCKALTAPTIQSNTFSSVGSSIKDEPKVLRVPEGASGYDEGYWKSTVLDKGYTLEYVPLSEL